MCQVLPGTICWKGQEIYKDEESDFCPKRSSLLSGREKNQASNYVPVRKMRNVEVIKMKRELES